MKNIKQILILFIFSFAISAQVVVEESVQTDTINLFDASKASDKYDDASKSVALAMFGNILLPGLGHKYLGYEKKAFSYFAIEAIALFGTIFTNQYSDKVYSNSRAYAAAYAGTRSRRSSEDEYWKNLAIDRFDNVGIYNEEQELTRHFDKKYIDDSDYWEWGSDESQDKYKAMRENASNLKVASSFFLGAMLLNRAVAMIDGRISAKRYNESIFSELSFSPVESSDGKSKGLVLVKKF